jgi:hypothetical protein
MRRTCFVLAMIVLGLFLSTGHTQPETLSEPQMEWLWGEIVSIDTANKIIVVKYLNYETETEKEISIAIDEKTAFENVKSLDELKPQDSVSIDYIISPEGKNLAQNISVEKPEPEEVAP